MVQARVLYAKTYVDGKWTVGISWARMVATLTMGFEIEFGEPHAAERTLRSLTEHPDYGRDKSDAFYIPEHWLAAYDLWRGDVEGGLRRIRRLFEVKPRTIAFHMVRGSLTYVLEGPLRIPDPVPSALTEFTLEFLGMHQGMQKAIAAWDGSRAGLVDLLRDSHGRKPKPTRETSQSDV